MSSEDARQALDEIKKQQAAKRLSRAQAKQRAEIILNRFLES